MVSRYPENACQNAADVAIEHSIRLAKSNADNRRCGVATDSRQCQDVRVVRWKLSSELIKNDPRGLLQIPCSRIVSKPGPQAQQNIGVGLCQCSDTWKTLQKLQIVGNHGLHLCLLEHHLGDPDWIGVSGISPGKVTPVLVIPLQQAFLKNQPFVTSHLKKLCPFAAPLFRWPFS